MAASLAETQEELCFAYLKETHSITALFFFNVSLQRDSRLCDNILE